MPSRAELVPAPAADYAVAPGETLRGRLEELDMSQAELARRTGLTAKHVNQIVQGAASVSADVAQRLEYVTGTPAYWWLRLEADYQASQIKLSQQHLLADDVRWLDTMPVRELVRVGALPSAPTDKTSRLRQLLSFFGVANLDAYLTVWGRPTAAFRQSPAYAIDPGAVNAWLRLGELAAQSLPIERFAADALRQALPHVRRLTRWQPEEGLSELVSIAASCGVAVVFVPEVTGARAYGATRWVGAARRPVVQLSLRGHTEDKLWETVIHEFGHVLLHDRKEVYIESEVAEDGQSAGRVAAAEREAQAFAEDVLFPEDTVQALLELKSVEQVLDFAESIDIGPALVVARLHRAGVWEYRQGSHLKKRIPNSALPTPRSTKPYETSATARRRSSDWGLPGRSR